MTSHLNAAPATVPDPSITRRTAPDPVGQAVAGGGTAQDAVAQLTDDELTREVTSWAGRIAAGEARLLLLVNELDRRGAWAGTGLLSCAHWMSLHLGMGLVAARERLRVARALRELPVTAAAFAAGTLSWTQVRAISRVAVPADEQTYLDLAQHATGAQLERLVRGVRRARRFDEDTVDPDRTAWRMRPRVSYDEDGTLCLTFRVPAERGPGVLAGLAQVQATIDREHAAGGSRQASAEASAGQESSRVEAAAAPVPVPVEPQPASLTDAFVRLAEGSLVGSVPRAVRAQLTVQVDPLTGWGRLRDGELLPPTSLATVLRDLPRRLRTVRPRALTSYDGGRAARVASPALREWLGTVDGERCRFPGCSRRHNLHAHHVRFWSSGGTTDLANLVLMCSRHHTLVHRDGFRLRLREDRRLSVHTADGRLLAHHPAPPWREADELPVVPTAAISPSCCGQHLDLDYAVAVLVQQAA